MAKHKGSLLARHGNLTGGQINTICDRLLYGALEPLFLHTSALDHLPYTLLNLTQVYPRRKLSVNDNTEFATALAYSIVLPKEKQWAALMEMGVERFVWIKLSLEFVRNVADPYRAAYHRATHNPVKADLKLIRDLEEQYGANLYGVVNNLIEGLKQFFKFRDAIAEQFYFLATKSAWAYYNRRTKPMNIQDLVQLQMSTITKTLDRYSSKKGALTSYFKLWLKNSLSQGSMIEGLAYDVPNSVRHSQALGTSSHHNFAVSMDRRVGDDGEHAFGDLIPDTAPTPEQYVESKSTERRLLRLIKMADHGRTFRLIEGLPEVFTPEELQLLDSCTLSQTTDA